MQVETVTRAGQKDSSVAKKQQKHRKTKL